MVAPLPTLQIAICDDQKPQIEILRKMITSIVESHGYLAEILIFDEPDELASFLPRRPHIVVVDNVFGEENNSGIQFIAKSKALYPETLFIFVTGATFKLDQLGIRIPNPDIIATKSYLSTKEYQKYLGDEIFCKLHRYPIAALSIDAAEPWIIANTEVSRSEIHALVEQAIYEAGLVSEKEVPQVQLKKLSGGYSGALVFEMTITGRSRWANIPTVVKLAPRPWISDELNAFQTFVRWQLPHTLRVDVVGSGATRYMGIICYAFVLAGEGKTVTAKEALNKGNAKIVNLVLKDILRQEVNGWYRAVHSTTMDLNQFLADRREFNTKKDDQRDRALFDSLKKLALLEHVEFFELDGGYRFGSRTINSPRRAIFQHQWGPVVECFCHGDLNSNNIIANARLSRLGLIDFADSGRNHVFRDFVSFEASIRLEWKADEDEPAVTVDELCDAELRLFDPVPENIPAFPGYLEQVASVRSEAFKKFPEVPRKHYAALLALHHWRVNAVGNWPDVSVRRALMAIAASLHFLDK